MANTKLKLSFMTLGCPSWDLDTICRNGQAYGFDGVDFRGYLDTLDITLRPEFTRDVAHTHRQLAGAGLEVSAISSSIQVCVGDKYAANLEEARRTIAVAQALDSRVVRVFGGGDLKSQSREELLADGQRCVEALLALDGAPDLHWLFETHDIWSNPLNCQKLLEAVPDPSFGALWDIGNVAYINDQGVEQVYAAIGSRVGYVHIKDAVYDPAVPQDMGEGWHYVLPGEGQLPLAAAVGILQAHGYDGWLQFEHEKRWHPNLPEPEIAFPAFIRWARNLG